MILAAFGTNRCRSVCFRNRTSKPSGCLVKVTAHVHNAKKPFVSATVCFASALATSFRESPSFVHGVVFLPFEYRLLDWRGRSLRVREDRCSKPAGPRRRRRCIPRGFVVGAFPRRPPRDCRTAKIDKTTAAATAGMLLAAASSLPAAVHVCAADQSSPFPRVRFA